MSKHAKLSPSGSSRWLHCPGSVNLIDTLPKEQKNPESVYAAEGTKAHALGENCLKKNMTVCSDPHVQVYLDYIWDRVNIGTQLLIEEHCSLEYLGVPGLGGGTTDAGLINKEKRNVEIVDYKHGQGVVVEPKDNTQEMEYGLGLIEKFNLYKFDTVTLTIVQPRAFHPDGPIRSHTMTMQELQDWCSNTLVPIATSTIYHDAPLIPGESQCRWCPAAKVCPALHKRTQEVAQIEFADLAETNKLPSTEALTPEQIGRVLEYAEPIRTFLKEVESYAKHLVDQGTPLDGYKLVRKITRRKLTDDAEDHLWSLLRDDEIYEKKVLAMSKIEKSLKENYPGKYKELMDRVTTKPEGEVILAKESDRRKEVQPAIVNDFKDIT